MSIFILGLELYFAAILGVSGIAKLVQPGYFTATLHRHRILPTWSIIGVSRTVPWLEIAVAVSLIVGMIPVATAIMVLILFASFLTIEVILIMTKRATECGCYGVAYPQKVDGASVATSAILVSAAVLHFWLSTWVEPVGIFWRLTAIIFVGGTGCWLSWKIVMRRYTSIRRLVMTPLNPSKVKV